MRTQVMSVLTKKGIKRNIFLLTVLVGIIFLVLLMPSPVAAQDHDIDVYIDQISQKADFTVKDTITITLTGTFEINSHAGFADFAFYALQPERAHFIGGFGRIVDLDAANLLLSLQDAEPLVAAEQDIVSHMNADHADAVQLYATKLLGADPGKWRMTGIDPEGCDLVSGARALRLPFGSRITSATEARHELARLAKAARAKGS